MELAQHLEEGQVGSGIVDDALGTVLDEELEQLQGLVDLPPFFGGLLGEAAVDHGHDLIEGSAEGRR